MVAVAQTSRAAASPGCDATGHVAADSGVEPHEAGLASGLINTSQQTGGALGLAILASVANSRTDAAAKPAAVALAEGLQNTLLVGAGMTIAGAILAIVLVSSRASREHAQAAQRSELGLVAAAT
jgi:hypothetical protein